jgi:hypothetical protein
MWQQAATSQDTRRLLSEARADPRLMSGTMINSRTALKPDCSSALRRKSLPTLPGAMSGTLSPVRFESKSSEIAPISCNFQSNPGGFLCTADCVAEGEGFEPSVRFF